jgi:hypothetical protein
MGLIGALWGLSGVSFLLGFAIYRLGLKALEAFSCEFTGLHWAVAVAVFVLMGWVMGYRGFQLRFSPRVAARARYLARHPAPWRVVFAPFFCMAYFHTSRRRQITSIGLTGAMIGLVILFRLVPQPWRGIVDAGVVFGLAWGLVAMLAFSVRAFAGADFPYSPEVPSPVHGPGRGGAL